MYGEHRIEKLIRDGIPELIFADGRDPLIRQVDDQTVRPFVARKLLEEAVETYEALARGDVGQTREELADLLEVMERLLQLTGISWESVIETKRLKAEKRGGFQKNFLLADPPGQPRRLHSDFEYPLLPALKENLAKCRSAYMAVSFVMKSGVEQLTPALTAALDRGVAVRLLTSDYLDITEPDALEGLLRLPGAFQLRAYREPSRSYHPKAYIFEYPDGEGAAFVGSSNLSASALLHGIEWNYQIKGSDAGWPIAELIRHFQALFHSEHSVPIDSAFIEDYRARRQPRAPVDIVPPRPLPRPAQVEALQQLALMREQGERKAMVVAATGIGKTFLAAFDSVEFPRVLFLAHREELLTQAHASFAKVRPSAQMSFYMAGTHDTDCEVLFASVSTLSRPEHYQRFEPDAFDYIVVDEFHHAAAKSYMTLLHYFSPKFLLGLTATPYRADNRDIFALCDGNVAYKVTFIEAIAMGWLCPFHYFGVYDETNYEAITWRNGRYDPTQLSNALENDRRAAAVLEAYQRHSSSAAVGFCVSIAHATFMADYFTRNGIPAQAVYSGPDAPDRAEAIRALRTGKVAVLFTVDLFNEGVDIPEIDLVMFLRPTESTTIFLQQLGRGLRLHPNKPHLTVLDFIGNYKKVHYKLPLIAGLLEDEPDRNSMRQLLKEFQSGELQLSLPPGVELHFDLEAINLLEEFVKKGEPRRQRLVESYREVKAMLGYRPSMLELHRWGRNDVRLYRQEFGSWFAFLQSEGDLGAHEAALDTEVGLFLSELEKTAMTRSFKMVLLDTFVAAGGLESPVHIENLVQGFRNFFAQSERYARDLGPEVGDVQRATEQKLRSYLEKNPIAAWNNPGRGNRRELFFDYDATSGLFSYRGPSAARLQDFQAAVLERVKYRLTEYFEIRFERKNVFNVINAGENRGIIMLGDDPAAPVPKGQGWKQVVINGRSLWAKFAKVAINVVKEKDDDSKAVPNLLTALLEDMFGPGGYLPQHCNRVRISPVSNLPDHWQIEAMSPVIKRTECDQAKNKD